MAATRRAPGPPGHWLTGHLPEFRRDRLAFFTRCAREYGAVAALRLGPLRALLLSDPELIEYVLVTDSRNFRKHFALRMNRLMLGEGLLTSEGDFWLRQRRLAQPAFMRQRIAGYGPSMVAAAERLLAQWRDGETRDLHRDMTALTLEITAETLFGADVSHLTGEVGAALADAMACFDARIQRWYPVPHWLPTANNRRLKNSIQRLDRILYGFIDQRRKGGAPSDDLLSLLLRARDEEGGRMTDRQLRDEAMTLFLAAHETTALALSWSGYLLAQHPTVVAQLEAELQAVLGGRAPAVADLPALRYTECVVLEAMRVYPPVYTIGREALTACEIGGYPVPAGTTLFLSQWVMHHDARYFAAPEKFQPERWLDGLAGRLPKFAYFPFGGGPRLCIGNTFALMEAVLVLATVAQRFRFILVPDHPVTPWPSITLRPRYGIRVVLARR